MGCLDSLGLEKFSPANEGSVLVWARDRQLGEGDTP